jgi:nucleoid-associated protein YgaU
MKFTKSIALISMLAFSGAAFAQAPAAAPAAPAAPAATTPAAPAAKAPKAPGAPRSAKSLDCSKQADTQNLHGKPRKSFMSKCKKS